MKKLLFLAAGALLLTVFVLNYEGERKIMPVGRITAPAASLQQVPVALPMLVPPRSELIAKAVAKEEMPEIDISGISLEEAEGKIRSIDAKLTALRFVERGNAGDLTPAEQLEFRKLLHERNAYFEKRIAEHLSEG